MEVYYYSRGEKGEYQCTFSSVAELRSSCVGVGGLEADLLNHSRNLTGKKFIFKGSADIKERICVVDSTSSVTVTLNNSTFEELASTNGVHLLCEGVLYRFEIEV